jgi:hypothetical protein
MAADDMRIPESLTGLILAIPDDGWSAELMAVVDRLVRMELRSIHSPLHVGLGGQRWDDDSRTDLVHRCYAMCILGVDLGRHDDMSNPTRLENLRRQARAEGVGVGYLRRAIQNHLRDLQRKQAPRATAVFKRIREAVSQLASQGKLRVVSATPRLDKHSVVWLRQVSQDVTDPPTLARIVRAFPGCGRLSTRLKRLGEEPTQEVWELFDYLARSECAAFKVGDLLDVLAELAGEPSELAMEFVEDLPDRSAVGDLSAAATERLQGDLWDRIRRTVIKAQCAEPLRQRMLALVDARWELVNRPGTTELSLAQLGASCGMDRRRASEAWQHLTRLISDEFGVEVADRIANGPSNA